MAFLIGAMQGITQIAVGSTLYRVEVLQLRCTPLVRDVHQRLAQVECQDDQPDKFGNYKTILHNEAIHHLDATQPRLPQDGREFDTPRRPYCH